MSRPMLEVNRGTRSLSGQKAGRPTTQRAPTTGPMRVPSPPMTTIDTSRSESVIWNRRSVYGMFWTRPPRRAPPRPAIPPASEKARSFVRVGLTV